MFGQYVEALAEHAKLVFEEMADTEVMAYRVNLGEVCSTKASFAQMIESDQLDKAIMEEFVPGFGRNDMAPTEAAASIRKMGRPSVRDMDDVADDSVAMSNLIAKRPEMRYDVVQTGSAPNAIEICGHFHPHLVLMDLVVPEVDGLTAIADIRELYPDTCFIVLTSSKSKTQNLTARRLKAVSCLTKPVKAENLFRRAEKVLA